MRMTRHNFPTIALLVSVPLLALVVFGGGTADGATRLPLLTLLLVCELGFIVNAIAVYLGATALRAPPRPRGLLPRLAANLLLAVHFALKLLGFWPA